MLNKLRAHFKQLIFELICNMYLTYLLFNILQLAVNLYVMSELQIYVIPMFRLRLSIYCPCAALVALVKLSCSCPHLTKPLGILVQSNFAKTNQQN